MKSNNYQNSRFLHAIRCLCYAVTFFSLCVFGFFLTACKKQVDYFQYVSELRSNIFLAQTESFSLRIYSVTKETPYVADGVPKELSTRTEVYLTAPSGDKTCEIFFQANGKEYGGEMSYDNVKAEYYYSCSLNTSSLSQITCKIIYEESEMQVNASSVLNANTLSAKDVLNVLQTKESELFTAMTDKYGFAGEIYLRLIYEDAPYYYVGLIERNGRINAFLINAQTGKILAKRQS